MLNQVSTSRSATFFKIDRSFSRTFIENIFTQVSRDKVGNYECHIVQEVHTAPLESKISFVVFRFKDEPSFLVGSSLKEEKFAFLMLIEFGEYLAVLKKNVVGLEKLIEDRCSKLEYDEIYGLFSEDDPAYEKMSLSNMGISKAAILKRTLESSDLKGQLNSQSSRRSIANTATVRTKHHRHVLRPQASIISKTDSRTNFRDLLLWIKEIWIELQKGIRTNKFLNSFAQPIKYEQVRDSLVPCGLLLNISDLKSILLKDGALSFNGRVLSDKRLNSTLNLLDSTFVILDEEGKINIYLEKSTGGRFYFGELRMNPQSITVNSKWLKFLSVIHSDIEMTDLQSIVNAEQEFIVTYSTPEYIYKNKRVFRDRGIIIHCDEIEATLFTSTFPNISSEKGDFDSTSEEFSTGSIFRYVEDSLVGSGIVICDDLGDEWADYMELAENKVRLFHCKDGDSSTGASQLHEVVSQALKNIGRASFSIEELQGKFDSWNIKYSGTEISRIRTGNTIDEINERANALVKSPHTVKEIILVVPFLKKNEIQNAFQSLRAQEYVRPHIPQLVWLLSTFVAACKENGVNPIIFCS